MLKMYDLIITNVHLLANSSNHKVIFPEYSRNIPRMSASKIEVKKVQKSFCGLSCENFNIASLLSSNIFLIFIETVLH